MGFLSQVIQRYSDEVEEKLKTFDEYVTNTKVGLNTTLNAPFHNKCFIKEVGSFFLKTPYALNDYSTIDIAINYRDQESPEQTLQSIRPMLRGRTALIQARGDDFSMKTYINRRYPTLRCSDPDYESIFNINLIFLHSEHDYLIEQ